MARWSTHLPISDCSTPVESPVIVEGVFVLAILRSIDIAPDILVRVEAAGRTGSITWRGKFLAYLEEYPRAKAPDYVINWEPVE
jgi:hypothetical protein